MAKWRKEQKKRIKHIREWYCQFYRLPYEDLDVCRGLIYNSENSIEPPIIRYMILWAVFNALYNVLNLPNNEITKVDEQTGSPHIWGGRENEKIEYVGRKIAEDAAFVHNLYTRHKRACDEIANRHPDVRQPEGIQTLRFTAENKQAYVIPLNDITGVASLDNRKIWEDGSVVFAYKSLSLDLDDKGKLQKTDIFIKDLLFVLYQIRNNIVHGGSATFLMKKKEIASFALPLLDEIVQYLFTHKNLLLESEDEAEAKE